MSTDSTAIAGRVTRLHCDPAETPAPGTYYWHGHAEDQIWVRLQVFPKSKIEVDIWWNRLRRRPDVQLVFGIYADSVELGCLTGNGFDAPRFHRMGFGTFAVNIAIQALKACFPASLAVQGVLSNTAEAALPMEDRLLLEANRRAFWLRFGLDVVRRGDPPRDFLLGRVGRLRIVPSGMLAGQFPRCVSLGDFVSEAPEGLQGANT